MSDWFKHAFHPALVADFDAAMEEMHLRREGHDTDQPLDRVLRDKLFPDDLGERAYLQWLDAHQFDHETGDVEPDLPEPDHGIDR